MIVEQKQAIPSPARGQWCNMCGTRLTAGSWALPFARWGRKPAEQDTPESTPDGQATWSICVQCYERRLRCAACGVQVGTQAFMLEGDLRFYCPQCFNNRPRCDTCDRPVGLRYWSRPDGRKLCDRCQQTAVTDTETAHALWKGMLAHAERQLGMALIEPCHLRLVNRAQLVSLLERTSLHALDADSQGRCFGLFMKQGWHKSVIIEYGLPRIVMLEVMSHEFAHAWQSEHSHLKSSLQVQEGFAEWVAYRLLTSWGCYRRSDRMLRRNDLYGRGLKLVLSWETEGGKAEVFRRIRAASPISA